MSRRANGEGSWQTKTIKGTTYQVFRISIDGVQKNFYGKSKTQALEKYHKFISAPKQSVEQTNQRDDFYNYCHNWLFDYKHKSIKPKTFDYYEYIVDTYIKDTDLGCYTIKKLNLMSQKDLRNLFQQHLDSFINKSKSTLDGIYTVLLQVCKYGLTYQDFACNYMLGVEKVSEKCVAIKKKEIKSLEYSDVEKLLAEMYRKNEPDNIINDKAGTYVYGIGASALLFCCFTGLRWGEVSRLEWQDIKEEDGHYYFKVDKQYITIKDRSDSDSSYITISADPKSEKSERYIPLSAKALEILDYVKKRFPKQYKSDHLIFSTTDNPYSASTANRLLKAMCIRADVPIVSPHALRHSFASILLNEDEKNLYAVSDLLGHSSSDVTYKRYIDIFEKNKMNTINLFDKIKKR